VATADTGVRAVEAAVAVRPDLILMDVRLKGEMDGIRAVELINEKLRVPVIYLTGDSDQKTLQRAKAASAYGYVLKPFHIRNLLVAIEVAIGRFEMERQLEDNQLTYATILGSVADAVIAVDTQGRVRFMNGVAERLTGWSSREAREQQLGTVLKVTNAADGRAAADLIAAVLKSRATISLGGDAVVTSRDGLRVPVDGGMSCAVDSLGRLVGASITLRDVSERRALEAALLDAVGREQRRFGSDLHDGLGQELTGLALSARALATRAERERQPIAAGLVQLAALATSCIQAARRIAQGVSPLSDADGDLLVALEALASRSSVGSAVVLFRQRLDSPLVLDIEACNHLYRIAATQCC